MAHSWRFQRAGGFDQVVVDTADDLRNLAQLDQKLWVALACPVVGNELDETTLALVDSDGDGRIRAPELLAAIAWCDATLHDLGAVLAGTDGLELSNIADAEVLAGAKRILKGLERPDATTITVGDTSGARELLDAMPFNGDGVVPPSSATDDDTRAVLQDILDTVGGTPDRSGVDGVAAEQVEAYWSALAAYEAWWRRAEEDEDTVVPLGVGTAPAVEAFVAVKAKIEDFFTRCDLAAFDARAATHLVGAEERWDEIAARTLSPLDEQIAAFPLAAIGPGRSLPLGEGLNPAWSQAMAAFTSLAVVPLLGEVDALDRAQWADLGRRFAAYEAWLAAKEGQVVEPLGILRVRALLAGSARADVEALLARDESRKPEADSLQAVDRATRYHRDLLALVRNFVTFRNFYRPDTLAMFQAGVLYLDGRSCDLVMRVEDVAKHSATAGQSYAYLAYLECRRKVTGQKMSIAAAFTDGDSDFLAVGRNGLLYDRRGQDWDATIVKVVEQPISIRQAFWSPYKQLVAFVSDQAERFASSQDKAARDRLTTQAGQGLEGAAAAPASAPAASAAFDIGKFAGIFAAVGLGVGFVLSALTMVVSGFLSLRVWQMPLAIAGVMLLISAPSMLVAAFKLRLRNLAPLLDANGWAINARARINIPFGRSLTHVAALPAGAQRDLSDPYKERGSRLPWIVFGVVLIAAVALAWDLGLQAWLASLLPTPPAPAP